MSIREVAAVIREIAQFAPFPCPARRGMISDEVPDPARSVFQVLIAALVLSAACSPTPVEDDASFAQSLA